MSRMALVIGIDNYQHGNPLSGCVADAKSMERLLSRHEDGSPNCSVRSLYSEGNLIVTNDMIKDEAEALFTSNNAEVALFYFAGHGAATNLGGYLISAEADRNDHGLALSELLAMANASPARHRIIILDCCQSGIAGNLPDGQNTVLLNEGVVILAACRETEYAVEQDGGGLFTTLMSSALDGGGADVCGKVTIASAYTYADEVLSAWDQRPLFKTHTTEFCTLRQCKPSVAPEILRLMPSLFPKPDFEIQLGPEYEPTVEPRDADKEKTLGQLQAMYRARLVEPVDAEHMFFAAVNSKQCRLTALGQFYWHRVSSGKI